MKTIIAALALVCLCATPALAQQFNGPSVYGAAQVDTLVSLQPAADAHASASVGPQTIAPSQNASLSTGPQTIAPQQSTSVGGQVVTVEGDVTARQVATAYAPPVVNVASCAIGGSVGGQGSSFGFSLGGAKIDKDCNARAFALVLDALGAREAALNLLAQHDPKIAAALGR